jgi:hypothetical protein
MKDVEIRWDQPHAATWRSGLTAEDVDDLRLDGLNVEAAPGSGAAAIELKNAAKVTLLSSRGETIHLTGKGTRQVRLLQTDAKIAADSDVSKDAVVRR